MSTGPSPDAGTTPAADGMVATDSLPVALADVEKVLTGIWERKEVVPGSSQGVLTRACMSNLLVVCEGRDQAEVVTREVDLIVSRHPSRVLLLVSDPEGAGGQTPVQAAVSAHCHLSGDHRQVCSEVVTIEAGGDEVRKLPSAARALLVGDLPTSLWWARPDPPVLAGDLFDELRQMADQVVYSSLHWVDPVRGTLATADWVAHSGPDDPVAIDLAWRALRPWRQLMSQSLDPLALPDAVGKLDRVEIDHGPGGLAQAWLLAGWLASALGWAETERTLVKGHEISWRFRTGSGELVLTARRHGEGEADVRNVRVSWREGGRPAALTFAPTGPGYYAASAEGINAETRVLAARARSRAALVAAELAELEPDRVFHDALRVSRGLAEDLSL